MDILVRNRNAPLQKFYADGSASTLETLKAEKAKLEKRLAEIPSIISKLQNSVKLIQDDITWLSGINNRKKRQWEKENGKSVEQAIYDGKNTIVSINADITTLNNEKNRIPAQIKDVDDQIKAMVTGESTGLSKGISKETARQLGEMELAKERNEIETQKQINEVKVQAVQKQAEQEAKPTGMNPKLKWGLIIGSAVVTIIILIMIFKRKAVVPALS